MKTTGSDGHDDENAMVVLNAPLVFLEGKSTVLAIVTHQGQSDLTTGRICDVAFSILEPLASHFAFHLPQSGSE